MRMLIYAVILALLVPSAFAAVEQQVDLRIGENGTLEQQVTLTIVSVTEQDFVLFPLDNESVFVDFNGTYAYENGSLVLMQPIHPGSNKVSFTILRNNASRETPEYIVLGSSINATKDTALTVSLTLPEGYVLSDVEPAVSPRPTSMVTDGRSLVLGWKQYGSLDIIVLYEKPVATPVLPTVDVNGTVPQVVVTHIGYDWTPVVFAGALIVLIIAGSGLGWFSFMYTKTKRSHGTLMDTLGSDEQLIVELLRKGFSSQKKIAQELNFSKSKMSKVVRKLEEKKVIQKEPFFKTNKLRLLPNWK